MKQLKFKISPLDFIIFFRNNILISWIRRFLWEVCIIGIGIFIGLQADNWNQERLEQKHIIQIQERIVVEIDKDIKNLERNWNRFKTIEPVFESVRKRSTTPDLLDDGLATILQETAVTVFNTSGVDQLKTLSVKDSLSLNIIGLYDRMRHFSIIPLESRLTSEAIALNNYYRTRYSWYPEWVIITPRKNNTSKELQDYFLRDEEYRNLVISRYELIYEYYLPSIRQDIRKLKEVRESIKTKLSNS